MRADSAKEITIRFFLEGKAIPFGDSRFPNPGIAFHLFYPKGRMACILPEKLELVFESLPYRRRKPVIVLVKSRSETKLHFSACVYSVLA